MEKDNSFVDKVLGTKWMPYGIIIAIGFILYFQAFFFNFSYLDDNVLILGNAHLIGNFSNIVKIFQTDLFNSVKSLAVYYRPIMNLSFMIDYHLGSVSPFIYHFTNVALHITISCLLFLFLKKLNYRKDLAFLFSILFLVHPALSQVVDWIPGRNDSLLFLFILLTFIFFINYLRKEKIGSLIWSLIFFALALFTKESAICVLPLMLFYLYFFYKEKGEKLSFNKFYFFIWSIGIVGIWAILRHFALKYSTLSVTPINLVKSIYFDFPSVIQSVGKMFFPFNLSVYPIMRDTTFLYGIASIILLAIMLYFTKAKRWNFILFGILWFFAFLVSSFIHPDPSLVSNFIEHRLYVPIIGIFIILLETDFVKNIDFKKKSTLILSGGLILLFIVITIVHSRNFVDRMAFWKDAAETSPDSAFVHNNLGAMYYLDGDMNDAGKEFQKAIEINPSEPMANNNLGLVYMSENKLADAETEYKKELEVNPNYDNAYFNLGLLYWQEKNYTNAEINWKKTLEVNPDFIDAINALAVSYYVQKDYKNAIPYASELYQMGINLPPEILQMLQNQ